MPGRRKKPPVTLPDDGQPVVGVAVTAVTTDQGIAVDVNVRVYNGPPGLEAVIGAALREPATELGVALAAALGTHLRSIAGPIAASQPGRS